MKKRSILAATAMLLVAILAATGATYAWFTQKDLARTDIEMKVATASSLEISVNDADAAWVSYLTAADFELDTNDTWADHSAVDNASELVFFNEQYYSETEIAANPAYAGKIKNYASSAPVSITIRFRSTNDKPISLLNSTLTPKDNTLILEHLRVAINNNIYGNNDGSYDKAIADAAGATGTQTWAAIETAQITPWGEKQADGYYYGNATFYFWVEGPLCTNAMATGSAIAKFTFSQI